MSQEKNKIKFKFSLITMTSLFVTWGLVFSIPFFCINPVFATDNTEVSEDDLEKKEADADKIEDKMDDLQGDLKKIEEEKTIKEQKKLLISNEIGSIKQNISLLESEIKTTENEINRIESEISKALDDIDAKKKLTGEVLRQINRTNRDLQLIAYGSDDGLKEYFATVDNFENMENRLSKLIVEIKQKKDTLEEQKKAQKEIITVHDDQKETLEYQKNKQAWALTKTQQEINSNVAEIGQIQSKISKMKSEISKLLGSGYEASDIKEAVKFASKKTGVRRDFLMGMLVVESDLGRFTGGCDYKESRMNEYRKTVFKQICKEVDRDYKKVKVSCPPSGYVGTGGAMGVEQFMSDTWLGYKDAISAKTGNYPPDPWNLTDGVMAMALKLAKDGATSKSGECAASKRYLGGSHDWYCQKVQYWADNYEQILD